MLTLFTAATLAWERLNLEAGEELTRETLDRLRPLISNGFHRGHTGAFISGLPSDKCAGCARDNEELHDAICEFLGCTDDTGEKTWPQRYQKTAKYLLDLAASMTERQHSIHPSMTASEKYPEILNRHAQTGDEADSRRCTLLHPDGVSIQSSKYSDIKEHPKGSSCPGCSAQRRQANMLFVKLWSKESWETGSPMFIKQLEKVEQSQRNRAVLKTDYVIATRRLWVDCANCDGR